MTEASSRAFKSSIGPMRADELSRAFKSVAFTVHATSSTSLPSTSMVVWSSALPLDWQHARRNGMSDAGCQPLGVLVGNRNEQRLRSKRFDEVTLDSVRRGNVGLLQYREMHEAHRRDSRTSSSCRPPFVGVRRPDARRCRVRLATLSVLCKRFDVGCMGSMRRHVHIVP